MEIAALASRRELRFSIVAGFRCALHKSLILIAMKGNIFSSEQKSCYLLFASFLGLE